MVRLREPRRARLVPRGPWRTPARGSPTYRKPGRRGREGRGSRRGPGPRTRLAEPRPPRASENDYAPTTNALAWTWQLLAENPEVEACLHAEVDAVLGGRSATAADVPRLLYTEYVIAESKRLFPPSWAPGRVAAEDVCIGEWEVRARDAVFVSQWVTQRDARYFPDPLRFDPDRWEPAAVATRPKLSCYPF